MRWNEIILPSLGLPFGLPVDGPTRVLARSLDSCIFSKLWTCDGTGMGWVILVDRICFTGVVFSIAARAKGSGRDSFWFL